MQAHAYFTPAISFVFALIKSLKFNKKQENKQVGEEKGLGWVMAGRE